MPTPITGNSPGTSAAPGSTGYVVLTANVNTTAATVTTSTYSKSGPTLPTTHDALDSVQVLVQWTAATGVTATFAPNGLTVPADGSTKITAITLASGAYPTIAHVNSNDWLTEVVTFTSNGTVTPGSGETRNPSTGTASDGSFTIVHADGSYTTYYSDGSTTTYNPNGSVRSTTAATTTATAFEVRDSGASSPISEGSDSGADLGSGTTTTGGGTTGGTTTATGTVYDIRAEVHYSVQAHPTVTVPGSCNPYLDLTTPSWMDTGVTLAPGGTVTVQGSGTGTYDGYTVVGPNGLSSFDSAYDGGSTFVFAVGRTPYSLVAYVGPSDPSFNVASSLTTQLGTTSTTVSSTSGGKLFVGFNERGQFGIDARADNTGSFCLSIGTPTNPGGGGGTNTLAPITGTIPSTTANPCSTGTIVYTTTGHSYYGSSFVVNGADFTKTGPTLPANASIDQIKVQYQYQGDKAGQTIRLGLLGYDLNVNSSNPTSGTIFTASNPSRLQKPTVAQANAGNWFSDTVSFGAGSSSPQTYTGRLNDIRIELTFSVPCGNTGTVTENANTFLQFAPDRKLWMGVYDGRVNELEWNSSTDAYIEGEKRDAGLPMPDGYWQGGRRRGTRRRLMAIAVDPQVSDGVTVTNSIESSGDVSETIEVKGRWQRVGQIIRAACHWITVHITETSPEVRSIELHESALGQNKTDQP